MLRPQSLSAAALRASLRLPGMRETSLAVASRIFNGQVTRPRRIGAATPSVLRVQQRASSTASAPQRDLRAATADKAAEAETELRKKLASVEIVDGGLRLGFGHTSSSSSPPPPPLAEKPFHVPALWLRDMCACPACVDPDSGQKNFSTCDLPDRPVVQNARAGEDGALTVVWGADTPSAGRAHTSVWTHDVLRAWYASGGVASPDVVAERALWDRAVYEESLRMQCEVSFADWIAGDAAFWRAFAMLCRTGLLFVKGVPRSETAVESVAGRIGPLQETFYGRTWDVRSKPRAENVAYTSVFLGLHQDLLYMDDFPRLQFLHCLDNSCDGGESLFSDGVRAAYELAATRRDLYNVLRQPAVSFHYNKGDHHYFKQRRVITEMETIPGTGEQEEAGAGAEDVSMVDHVSWAPPFQGPFARESPTPLGTWKKAATVFEKTLSAPENMVECKLEPGDCVIFDNRRVLHGRRQFNTSQGQRWLKGCYIHRQPFQARLNSVPRSFLETALDTGLSRSSIASQEAAQVVDMLARH